MFGRGPLPLPPHLTRRGPVPHDAAIMRVFLRLYGVSLLAGLLLALSFPAWNLFWLAWLAPGILIWRTWRSRPAEAAAQFFACGFVFHLLLLQWLSSNIFWAGGYALLGYLAICAILALFWAVLGAAWAWIRTRMPVLGGAAGFAVLWLCMEQAQARMFTGFGWSALGYSQTRDAALLQCAALGGVSLISFVLVLVSALLAGATAEKRLRYLRIAGALLVVAAAHIAGAWLRPGPTPDALRVGIIQTGIPQEMKFRGQHDELIADWAAQYSYRLAQQGPMDLMVWPEATVMDAFDREPYLGLMTKLTRDTGAWLFAGVVRAEQGKSYNSSVLISPEGQVMGHYDKVHLAPFGEYMPFDTILPLLRQITPVDVDAGADQCVLPMAGHTLGPLICFEVLFSPMALHLRDLGADMLVVVTNLTWFGLSNAASQELAIARLRAVETGLPVIHAANSGISGVIDPSGELRPMHDEYPPEAALGYTCMRTIAVPGPVHRLLPAGPAIFPWLACAAGLIILIAAAAAPRFRRGAPES